MFKPRDSCKQGYVARLLQKTGVLLPFYSPFSSAPISQSAVQTQRSKPWIVIISRAKATSIHKRSKVKNKVIPWIISTSKLMQVKTAIKGCELGTQGLSLAHRYVQVIPHGILKFFKNSCQHIKMKGFHLTIHTHIHKIY